MRNKIREAAAAGKTRKNHYRMKNCSIRGQTPLYTDKVLIYIRVKDTFHKVGGLLTGTAKNFS